MNNHESENEDEYKEDTVPNKSVLCIMYEDVLYIMFEYEWVRMNVYHVWGRKMYGIWVRAINTKRYNDSPPAMTMTMTN